MKKKTVKARKKMSKKSSKYLERNRKVALNRGESWKRKLLEGTGTLGETRALKGLSQDAISTEVGVHRSTYGEIERGARAIRPELADKISSVLKVSKVKLFRKTDNDRYAVR